MAEQITKKDLEPIHGSIQALTKSIERIELALLGDEDMKIEGIAGKVHQHGKYISKNKQRAAWITGAAGGVGFGLHQFWEWVKNHL